MESYMSLDKNFVASSTIGEYDVNWFDIRKKPFSIHGLYQPETTPFYQRMPLEVAEECDSQPTPPISPFGQNS